MLDFFEAESDKNIKILQIAHKITHLTKIINFNFKAL